MPPKEEGPQQGGEGVTGGTQEEGEADLHDACLAHDAILVRVRVRVRVRVGVRVRVPEQKVAYGSREAARRCLSARAWLGLGWG